MPDNCGPAQIILVHGTWAGGLDRDSHRLAEKALASAEPLWFEPGSKFCAALDSGLAPVAEGTRISAFHWSGSNSIVERRSDAGLLAKLIDASVAASPKTPHFIIAHSHGGNIALDARQNMQGDAGNVHVMTVATPFISISKRAIRIADRLFTVLLLFGIIARFASYIWPYIGDDGGRDITGSVFLPMVFLSLLSLTIGAIALFETIQQRVRGKPAHNRLLLKIPNSWQRINNKSLLAALLLTCLPALQDPSAIFEALPLLFPLALPPMFAFFVFLSAMESVLYSNQYDTQANNERIPNLTILRGHRDEASLALLFGKITSFMARAAASISIFVSIAALLLILALLGFIAYYVISHYDAFERCLDLLGGRPNNGQCTMPGDIIAVLLLGVDKMWNQGLSYYFVSGLYGCIILILLTALCKSLFGKELLYGSLNSIIDVYDTPGGAAFYKINWCTQAHGGVFTLHHSLYNNPEAVKTIVAHIARVCTPGNDR